jgi:hypothetical protein
VGRVVPVSQRRVEGVGGEHHVRLAGFQQVLGGDPEPLAQLAVLRDPAELVG